MDKIQNLHDLEYYASMLLISGMVKKWTKAKPHNKDLKKLTDALLKITLYVPRLQDDLRMHKMAISEYRYDKNKALLELKELKKKYEKLSI
jgi:hypothetical protein